MKKDIDVPRLCQAMRDSRRAMEVYRVKRREATRQYVGMHWSEEGSKVQVPVNLIGLYVTIVSRSLIAKNPRVMFSTFSREHRPAVSGVEAWGNREIERMRLDNTLRRIVTDALFAIGIAKIALATPCDAAAAAWSLKAGDPYVERVDLDDLVFDMHARDLSEAQFVGHRVRVPIDAVKDSKYYSKARKKLEPTTDNPYNYDGDERISVMGRGNRAGETEFEDMVDLWEIYLPRHKRVITLSSDALDEAHPEPLRETNWIGHDRGPYRFLCFGTVPGNAMPKAPIMDLIDLHESANKAYRKIIRMSERTKELLFVQGGAMEDGSRVMKADDGSILRVDRPEALKQAVMGGTAIQSVLAVATVLQDLFNRMAGNLEMMGGLGAQSKTATQDKMLNENSSKTVMDMQDTVLSFTADTLEAAAWYWWHHPTKIQRSQHKLDGVPEAQITREVYPAGANDAPDQAAYDNVPGQQMPRLTRSARWEDLDVRVDPYSMQHQTPQERMAAINQVVQQVILPMQPLLQQQGVVFDINAYLQKMAKFGDIPDLSDIITIQDPPAAPEAAPAEGEGPAMPAETTRNYVRENVSQRTRQGNDQQLVASMLGHDMGGAPS